MKKIDKNLSVSIKGYHMYYAPYILTNVYGVQILTLSDDIHTDTDKAIITDYGYIANADELLSEDYYEFSKTKALSFAHSTYLPMLDGINKSIDSHFSNSEKTLRDEEYTREMKLSTSGCFIKNSLYYGEDGNEMKLSVNGSAISLERRDHEGLRLYFEEGKRNVIAIPSVINSFPGVDSTLYAIQICLCTHEVKNNIFDEKHNLDITYSVEVNGFLTEKTRFIITVKEPN